MVATRPIAIKTLFIPSSYGILFTVFSREEDKTNFLNDLILPKISDKQLNALNAPVTESKINDTIATLANNKSPGPDGYTTEFYKTLKQIITTPLAALYNHMLLGNN